MSNETIKMKFEDLGYNDFFESKRNFLKLEKYSIARVISEYKGAYKVKDINGEYLARVTGKKIFNATKREDYPAVGDWVAVTMPDKEMAIIHEILPRQTILYKKYSNKQDIQIIATNIDTAFIVESVDRDYNLNRFERYLVLANEGKIKPMIILNKIDLILETELNQKIDKIKNRFNNIDIISTSTISEQGLDELMYYIEKGKTYCFLGSSGIGKSSLINKLIGKNKIKTNEISSSTHKGKHTTTTREMYFLENGGIVIDNPGTREVGVAGANTGIDNIFDKIVALAKDCKYADCTHTQESGCAVLEAVRTKKIDEEKYLNYIKLKKEAEHYEMTDIEKRRKDRKFGKFIKNSLDQLKKIKP
ncbi:MAG TPA: ribosome small subunit-dependent GTPase A [Candidatus Pacearchaeota archaeon]|nr:ribosome small subunit-dependent GTPase A [Candidatus Pacearchaeota archaeon]HPR79647.1 ribosome small subunit-dependent GTPase A [Candidatus Pacearchaeota archaeon]